MVALRLPYSEQDMPVFEPMVTGKSNEWFTPSRIIEAARKVMGDIDLDPASCELANTVVRAKRYYTKEEDGLSKEWTAKSVWLNPPYKSDDRISLQSLWVGKALDEYSKGNVKQIILCVTGVVERKWFYPLWDYLVCFPNYQIHFKQIDNKMYHHPYGTVFVYIGCNEQQFINVFSKFGTIAKKVISSEQPITPRSLWEGTL